MFAMVIFSRQERAYCQGEFYGGYSDSRQNNAQYAQAGWSGLKRSKPVLYHVLNFLNPPLLNNVLGNILSFFIAIGCLTAIFGFEGDARAVLILICIYFWTRLISLFVVMNLIGRGVLSP